MSNYAIKSTMYPNQRAKSVDGPWKPSVEEAVKAYAASLRKKGLGERAAYQVFVAETCPAAEAPASDGKHHYKTNTEATPKLAAMFEAEGIKLGSTAR